MAPLMQWVDIRGYVDAYRFDQLMTSLQIEHLKKSGLFDDLKNQLHDRLSRLQMHLNPVREKADVIKEAKSADFWNPVTIEKLETVRRQLRGIMQYSAKVTYTPPDPKFIDIKDGQEEYKRLSTKLKFSDMPGYRKHVQDALLKVFDENPTLQKIKSGRPVSTEDLKALTSLVLTQNPNVDQEILREFFEETAEPLDHAIRSIIGVDADVVSNRFSKFVTRYPSLTSSQVSFLNLLKNHISRYGSIKIGQLYEAPFTALHSDGLDGVFADEKMIDDLIAVIDSFKPETYGEMTNA